MKYLAMHGTVENSLKTLPRKGLLSIVAVIIIGWFLRELFRLDGRDENYVIRAYKGYYIDPTNLYKFYGSYGKS